MCRRNCLRQGHTVGLMWRRLSQLTWKLQFSAKQFIRKIIGYKETNLPFFDNPFTTNEFFIYLNQNYIWHFFKYIFSGIQEVICQLFVGIRYKITMRYSFVFTRGNFCTFSIFGRPNLMSAASYLIQKFSKLWIWCFTLYALHQQDDLAHMY